MVEPQKWDYRILRLGWDKFIQGSGTLPRDRDEWVNPYLEAMGARAGSWWLLSQITGGLIPPPPSSSSGLPSSSRSHHTNGMDRGWLPGPASDTVPHIMRLRTGRRTAPIL